MKGIVTFNSPTANSRLCVLVHYTCKLSYHVYIVGTISSLPVEIQIYGEGMVEGVGRPEGDMTSVLDKGIQLPQIYVAH